VAHYGRRIETASPESNLPIPLFGDSVGDLRGLVDMKLRLYRNYSIKLMLAWESAAASIFSPLTPFDVFSY
jgi:hypothetical protein